MKQLNDRIGQVEMCFREFQKVMELKLKYYNLKIN